MYAAMWSEHCSYKSSKVHLRTLPTEGAAVLVGPGQDAGAVDIGDGGAAVFKMESHSHPSAIEPYQGAATGVGGIVRDIISMGARPVALLDPLMFGPLTEERNRWLLAGVVAGIGGYGNCIGVPTVGGEVRFADPHSANPTRERDVRRDRSRGRSRHAASLTAHEGSLMVLYGAATGRDGIGGVAVLASARPWKKASEASRPSCADRRPVRREAADRGVARDGRNRDCWRDCRTSAAPGITCAVSESASRAGMGARTRPGRRAAARARMEPFEILTSESQERMLAIVTPRSSAACRRSANGGGCGPRSSPRSSGGGTLTVRAGGEIVADVPARSLADEGPEYERPLAAPDAAPSAVDEDPTFAPFKEDLREAFLDGARVAERGRQALGLRAVRLARAGPDGRGLGRGRSGGARAGHAEGPGAVDRRQGPLRRAGPLPGRGARGGRGRPQRRGHRARSRSPSRTA